MKLLIIIFLIISILFALGTAGFVIYDIIRERREKAGKENKTAAEKEEKKQDGETEENKS
jgi:uncharacterized protein YxeA